MFIKYNSLAYIFYVSAHFLIVFLCIDILQDTQANKKY